MNLSTLLKTSLVLAVFLRAPVAGRADGDRETEALRKEMQALRAEVESLVKLLRSEKKERQSQLQEKTREVEELRRIRLQAEIEAKAMKDRALALEARVRELTRELERAKASLPPMKVQPPTKDQNFPAAKIEGRIVEIDKESKLLKLSIGSDAGLAQGHHLHVYRLDSKPEKSKYLGTIEVLSVRPTEAVARMSKKLPSGVALEVGDRVASQLFEQPK